MQREDIERRLAQFFEADPRCVAAVYLFGSHAKGTGDGESDVDVGVLYRTSPRSTLDAGPLDLEADLERELLRPVDLVLLNRAAVDLRARILREGRLVFEGDPSARVRFEVSTRKEAFDFEPVLRQYRSPRERRP